MLIDQNILIKIKLHRAYGAASYINIAIKPKRLITPIRFSSHQITPNSQVKRLDATYTDYSRLPGTHKLLLKRQKENSASLRGEATRI